MILIGSSDPA